MKRAGKWIWEAAFIAAAAAIIAGMIWRVKQKEGEEELKILPGFQVFLEGEEISALYPAENGLWTGGRDGVKCLDYETGEILTYIADDLQLIYAAEICASYDGTVWIGHNEGVTLLSPDGARTDLREPELTGGRVNAIFCGKGGQDVWVGTMEGANRFAFREGEWKLAETLTRKEGLLSDTVNVIAGTGDRLWFGSYLDNKPGGISILSVKGWEYFTVKEGLAHPYINAILPLEDCVLAGCGQLNAGGLSRLEPSEEGYGISDLYTEEDGLPGPKIRWLWLDSEGRLWITTESEGLLLCNSASALGHPVEGLLLTREQGLSDNEIKKIVESDQYYWLAGRYGLTRIEKSAAAKLLCR